MTEHAKSAIKGGVLKLNSLPDRMQSSDDPFEVDLLALVQSIKRQLPVILVMVVLFLSFGVAYLLTATPRYTSEVTVLIDSRRNQDQVVGTSIAELSFDTGAIDSQVEVIRSDRVLGAVVSSLNLYTKNEFVGGEDGYIAAIFGLLRGILNVSNWFTVAEKSLEDVSNENKRAALRVVKDNIQVSRVARTFVIRISYTDRNAALAAQIANAVADAYFRDQLDARFDSTRRATGWLQDRLEELRVNSLRTDLAVQRFKADNGIIATGQNVQTGNQLLVADQQLMELTTQLTNARAETSKAEARVQQITDIIRTGKAEGAVTEALGNPVINDFRTRYLRASKTAEELEGRLGKNHFQVASLRREMAQFERLLFEELQRIAETYVSDLEVARSRERSLNDAMATLVGQKAVSNEVMVQLRELEREAEVFRTLYQNFLQKYQDAIQRESFPTTEARVLSPAVTPRAPSAPRPLLVLALSGLLGLFAGLGTAILRERHDSVFRTGAQVRGELGLDFLGTLPLLENKVLSVDTSSVNSIRPKSSMLRYTVDHPLSRYSEVLRATKVEIDLTAEKSEGKAIVVGLVSVLPGEGKSTTAKNFASMLSTLGCRTLLIDGDIRNPSLSKNLALEGGLGLFEVVKGGKKLSEATLLEPETGLVFLPCIDRRKLTQGHDLIGSPDFRRFLNDISRDFDYVIVDLPPIGPVIDVRAAGHLFDSFIFTVLWGRTPRGLVKNAFVDDPVLYDKCVGVLFNKADLNAMKEYEDYNHKGYYYGRYSEYYRQ